MPPVTAERSPPDSRTTGADSPVMADSSTDAMPWMMSPSPGIGSPADTTTMSPRRRSPEETSVIGVRSAAASAASSYLVTRCATVDVRVWRSVSACALPRPSATASARFAKTTVSQSQIAMPQVNETGTVVPPDDPGPPRNGSAMAITVVSAAPISTMNMTGLCHICRGSSLRRALGAPGGVAPDRSRPWDASTASRSAVACGRSFRRWWWMTWISSALPPGDPA